MLETLLLLQYCQFQLTLLRQISRFFKDKIFYYDVNFASFLICWCFYWTKTKCKLVWNKYLFMILQQKLNNQRINAFDSWYWLQYVFFASLIIISVFVIFEKHFVWCYVEKEFVLFLIATPKLVRVISCAGWLI